jgi:outer membrane protein assembly factor BamB
MALLKLVDSGLRARKASDPLETIDLLVEGTNLTARIAQVEVGPLLRDLGTALCDLAQKRAPRRSVRCYGSDGSWEMGLEHAGERAWVSLFRVGPEPEVAVFEREVSLAALVEATRAAIDRWIASPQDAAPLDLTTVRSALQATLLSAADAGESCGAGELLRRWVDVQPEGEGMVRISAEIALRAREVTPQSGLTHVEQADLFGLLVRGTVRVGIGDRARTFSDRLVFLFAERLLSFASETLTVWEQGSGYHRRVDVFGVLFGARFEPWGGDDSAAGADRSTSSRPAFWLSIAETAPTQEGRTFRLPDARVFVQACVQFGRALARAFLRHDPAQKYNLRLSAFRKAVRLLDERLHETDRDDAKVNPSPETYRAFVVCAPAPLRRDTARLSFTPVWTASMPAIDLRSTFLCGDHLVVGALRETACLDRRTGRFLWRRPAQHAASVVTTLGLARLFPDGGVTLHDFASGEIVLSARVTPRAGGVTAALAVSSPGLPRLLVLSEGRRHLSAIDLGSGEVRWRHAARGGAHFRLRRAGRLLIVVSSDPTLTALDLASGEVVWRARDRLRFVAHVGLDHDSLFALAGEPDEMWRGPLRLYHLDPYSGVTRWARELPSGTRPMGSPLITDREVVLVTANHRGLGLLALDRASGSSRWSVEPGFLPVTSAWLAVDDAVVINSETGDLVSIATSDGSIRWRQRFTRGVDDDAPRRLEPILRSGALFVPQHEVKVIRPHDGALLGRIPVELIPDLLRVDEHCGVYVAEESGHIAAFRAGAKLSVVG